jgi:hypothetical protein
MLSSHVEPASPKNMGCATLCNWRVIGEKPEIAPGMTLLVQVVIDQVLIVFSGWLRRNYWLSEQVLRSASRFVAVSGGRGRP